MVIVQAKQGLFRLDVADLWHFRELLFFLVWRDIKVRYKQTLIGAGWAVFQPLMTMLIFTVIFGVVLSVPSEGIPYPAFSFSALLLWTFFSQAVVRSGGSLIAEAQLVKKIYFPRLIVPLSAVVSPLLDLCFSLPLLAVLLLAYGIVPGPQVLWLPVFVAGGLLTAVSAGVWLSALNAQYRDIGYLIPFMIQLGMYASPVLYPSSVIPAEWRTLYALNPMVGIIEGFRWTLFGGTAPSVSLLAANLLLVLTVLVSGLVYFRQVESTMPDII